MNKRLSREKAILRVMDANLNRSREGLRVCEDITRFVLNSRTLSRELKLMRKGMVSAMRKLPARTDLLKSRDARSDVGRRSDMPGRMSRSGCGDIFTANMQRVKESLRVLEEFSKLFDERAADGFQRLRFRAYEVEARAGSSRDLK